MAGPRRVLGPSAVRDCTRRKVLSWSLSRYRPPITSRETLNSSRSSLTNPSRSGLRGRLTRSAWSTPGCCRGSRREANRSTLREPSADAVSSGRNARRGRSTGPTSSGYGARRAARRELRRGRSASTSRSSSTRSTRGVSRRGRRRRGRRHLAADAPACCLVAISASGTAGAGHADLAHRNPTLTVNVGTASPRSGLAPPPPGQAGDPPRRLYVTLKILILIAVPALVVTETGPVVAPAGSVTTI